MSGAGGFFYVPPSADRNKEDLRQVLRTPHGRRMFRRMLAESRLLAAPGADNGSLEYFEGWRGFGVWLANELERAQTGALALLMRESAADVPAGRAREKKS